MGLRLGTARPEAEAPAPGAAVGRAKGPWLTECSSEDERRAAARHRPRSSRDWRRFAVVLCSGCRTAHYWGEDCPMNAQKGHKRTCAGTKLRASSPTVVEIALEARPAGDGIR